MLLALVLTNRGGIAVKKEMIRVGVYQNEPKVFLDEEGQVSGFFPALMNEIAEAENLSLQYIPCTWEQCLSDLEVGKLDLMVDVAYSPEREQRFDFNQEVVFNARSFLYTMNGITVDELPDLDQKRVAVLDGSIQEDLLRDRAQKLGIAPIWVELGSFRALFEQLHQRKVDIAVANEFIGKGFTQTYDNIQRSLLVNSSQIHLATPKGKNQELLNLIDRHLVTLKNTPNSVYHQALHHWLLGFQPLTVRSPWVEEVITAVVAISTLSIITIIIVTNYRLKKELIKRRLVEENLKQSDAQFKGLIQNVPAALLRYILYPDGSIQIPYMSPVCEKLWEIQAKDVEENANILWDMVHRDDVTPMQESVMLSAATLQPWFHEWRTTTPSGKQKWLQGRGNPKETSNKTIVWDTVIFDVTEQKLIEQALQESEQKLQEITNAVPGAVHQYLIDRKGNEQFLFMSEGIKRLYGITPQQVLDNPRLMWEVLDSETQSRLKSLVEYSATHLTPWDCEFEVTLADGEKKWIKGNSMPMQTENGIVWNGILVDISQQKWQEQLLATQQEILEDLAEGNDLETIFTELIRLIEQQTQGLMGSILLLKGKQLWHCGQSNLPTGYLKAINGIEIGKGVGSCGHTAACGELVIVADLETHPFWEDYQDLARTYGLKSCWSMPILSSNSDVLGTFALYSHTPRHPTPYEKDLISIASKVAALAIERKQQESLLEEKAEQKQLLTQVATRIRQSLDLQLVLDQTVQEIRDYLQADRVLIYRIKGEAAKVIAESVEEGCISILNKEINDPCLQSPYYLSRFQEGYIQKIADIDQADLEPCHRVMLRSYEVKANLVLGILQEEQVWGFLIAQHCHESREWQGGEVTFLQRLSEQVSIAIQQSELYEQVNLELQEKRELAEQLHFQAMHDALTQLPNRSLLMDRLQHTFQIYRRRSTEDEIHFSLLFLDLNDFKQVNDTLGHDAGDELLVTVANRLQRCLREMDTVARLGGDEFVVIIEDITGESDAIEVANRIHSAFAEPTYLNGEVVNISSSIGIVLDRPDYNYPEEMLRDADIAMYEAKQNHLKYFVFRSSMEISDR
ncbi:diguanylate cyclase with PAS/PAC and GAF sensors [Halothece sp. PCC 7418]|nr:diguanylate cyclase with PAS/PAC and GAF sensors [Halothece sp. PCC 7418]